MQFDLKKFLQTGRTPYKTALECELSRCDWPGYEPLGPVKVSFAAAPLENGVEIELLIEATISAPCARCLEPVTRSYSLKRGWLVREQDLSSEELELPISEKGELDVDELAFQELVLEVDPVLLCSADCKGLCPVCGNAKAAGCTCQAAGEEPVTDARLAILKQLLD